MALRRSNEGSSYFAPADVLHVRFATTEPARIGRGRVKATVDAVIRSSGLEQGLHLLPLLDDLPIFQEQTCSLVIGVRHSRRLVGLAKVTRTQWDEGKVWDDEIGVSTSLSPKFPNISVPYGSLVPKGIDGVLGAGRHLACDASSHTFLREIPQCWLSGQAAGVAAALAVNAGVVPRQLNTRLIQRELLRQGTYLSPSVAALAEISSAAE